MESDRLDQPAIGAGATLPKSRFDELKRVELSDWHSRLAHSGFHIGFAGDRTRVFRTMYLAEVTAKGATLDTQARALASWLEATTVLLEELAPPLLAPPGSSASPSGDQV